MKRLLVVNICTIKNMLAHLFSTKAFEKLVPVHLPYHRAFKKNDFINEEGMKEVASKPNSFKFEKFIFDSFKFFDKILLLQVKPEDEFAPIKSFTGIATPETALKLYLDHKKGYNFIKENLYIFSNFVALLGVAPNVAPKLTRLLEIFKIYKFS